jgi:hypothetical protein
MKKNPYLESINLRNLVSASLLILVCISAWVYIQTFYFRKFVEDKLVFAAIDAPYVVPGFKSRPILGEHRFGDFLTQLSFATSDGPYNLNLSLPSPYPPFGVAIFKPFSFISPSLGILILTTISLVLIFYAFRKILANFEFSTVVTSFLILVVLTKPVLLVLDRGNIQGIVVALCVLAFYFYENGNLGKFAILIAIAGALKGYPLLLLIVLFHSKQIQLAIKSIFLAFFLSIISLLVISPARLNDFPIGMIKGMAVQSGYPTSGMSFASWIFRIIEITGLYNPSGGSDRWFRILSSLIFILFFVVIFIFSIWKNYFPKNIELYVLLATLSFMIPVSWDYNAIAVTFLVIKVIANIDTLKVKKTLYLSFSIILLTLPFPFVLEGEERINVGLLDLVLPVLFLFYLRSLRVSSIK